MPDATAGISPSRDPNATAIDLNANVALLLRHRIGRVIGGSGQ
ncbi:hypothetical protein ACFQ9R_13565 [Nocardia sp. NPDC056541]